MADSNTDHHQHSAPAPAEKKRLFDKSLGTVAGLSKLLPTGTTLAFQTMAPSFTNGGECDDHDVNFVFTWGLIVFLALVCMLLCFTDSVTDEHGNTYYGVAACKGLKLFNRDPKDLQLPEGAMERKAWKWRDLVHAVLSAAVFVALAFCDAGVQHCLVDAESRPWRDFFTHLPLAVGFLASSVFIIWPSTRKGIGEDGAWDDSSSSSSSKDETSTGMQQESSAPLSQKSLSTVATLSRLLPTGTTLAFQAMAPSFTKGGKCSDHDVNYTFTWGLISFLTLLSALICFTDSVTDKDGRNTYYGVATVCGFKLFDRHCEQGLGLSPAEWEHVKKSKRLTRRDFLNALTRATVFAALAFCDAGVQGCLVPAESTQWKQFLAVLPLAVSFLASFVFMIYPSTRKGIDVEGAWDTHTINKAAGRDHGEPKRTNDSNGESSLQAMAAMSITRVAPSTSYDCELEPAV